MSIELQDPHYTINQQHHEALILNKMRDEKPVPHGHYVDYDGKVVKISKNYPDTDLPFWNGINRI